MSGAAARLESRPANPALRTGRSPLAHLLHALNQPLTGLQCSLELAAAGPRRPEYYRRVIEEGMGLTSRMRILVEAMRELSDLQLPREEANESLRFDLILQETAEELFPIAESSGVRLFLESCAPLTVISDRHALRSRLFRLLESALSLASTGSELRVVATLDEEKARLVVSWNHAGLPEYSPFSRPELGLLVSQAAWERAGAEWRTTQEEGSQQCELRVPLFPERVVEKKF